MTLFTVLYGFVALVGIFYWLRRGKIKNIPEPPGNFFIGHVFQLRGNFCRMFLKWKKTLGPVFQLRLVNVRVVVFNDIKSIVRVFAMPEASGRIRTGFFQMMFDIVGEGVGASEGPIWKEQQGFLVRSLKTFAVGRPQTEQNLRSEIEGMFREWDKSNGEPFQLQGSNTPFVFNALWSVLASTQIQHSAIFELSQHLKRMTQMDTIGHKMTFLSTELAGKFSNAVEEKRQALQAIANVAHESVAEHQKDRMPGEPRDVIDDILDRMDATDDVNSAFHRKNLKNGFALGEVIVATIDSTSKALEWLMLFLARNPKAESKLQAEIDKHFNDEEVSWATLADRGKMPYTQACILETLRLGSVTPFGVPHRAMEDFEFNGAIIPKGTILILNQFGINHDPALWDRPEEFEPERFLTADESDIDMNVRNNLMAFSIGRRMCPGKNVALDSMFLYVVNVYRKFTFEVVGHVNTCEGRFGLVNYPPDDVLLKAIARMES